jgi:AraC-like DNA-binding protein
MASAMLDVDGGWTRVPISQIEDLEDAVLGAGLEAVQMSRTPVSGGLAFAADGEVTYSSGLLNGHIALTGPLSESMVTLGVGLRMAPGARHWLNEVPSRAIGVFLPGDVHEAHYTPGTLYATVTLSFDRLEEIAAGDGLLLSAKHLGGTGISQRPMDASAAARLERGFLRVHERGQDAGVAAHALGRRLLDALIAHLASEPRRAVGAWAERQHGRIVERARRYILGHLEAPLPIDAIADAAFTSRRTLHRAFLDVLGVAPQSYVRTLRVNRIRHDLATEQEAKCTISTIANRWGIGELGRLSAWYRDLFGELPSETRARHLTPS